MALNSRRRPLRLAVLALVLVLAALIFFARSGGGPDETERTGAESGPQNIVSLTPVGTEILFALGQGPNIKGVTRFCDYPPEVADKPKVGGFTNLNLEALVAIKADLIVLQDLQTEMAEQLERLGIPVLLLKQDTMEEVYSAIEQLGAACCAEERAAELIADMKKSVEEVKKRIGDRERPRVLICVSRELTEPKIRSFYAAGRGTFYDELIEISGGVNACTETQAQYPTISVEGLSSINPDVIIELIGDKSFYHTGAKVDMDEVFDVGKIKKQWEAVPGVKASREGRVYVFGGTVFLRPGPRIGKVISAFGEALHPEAFGK